MRPIRRIKETNQDGFVVNLPTEVVVREIPALTIKSSSLEVMYIRDESLDKKIISKIKGIGEVTLWESDQYDRMSQWTNEDVKTRLIELFLK
jgi:hypothetical protein